MEWKRSRQADALHDNEYLLRMLDRDIDDMETGRELPLEDAFKKITELRDARRNETKRYISKLMRNEQCSDNS